MGDSSLHEVMCIHSPELWMIVWLHVVVHRQRPELCDSW